MILRRWSWALVLVAIAALATLRTPLDHPAEDAFHEGEYVSAWVLPFVAQHGVLPRLIHGGMDHIPARVAAVACDAERQIACVRRINALLAFAASAMFLLTALLLVSPLSSARRAVALLPAVSLVVFVNGGAADAVDLQQGAPSVRDLIVVAVLLPLVAWCRRQGAQTRPGADGWLLVAAGVVAGLGWFWAYNRGTVGLFTMGAAAVGAVVLLRDWRAPLIAAAAVALGILLSDVSGLHGSTAGNIDNIAYWMRHRDLYATRIGAQAAMAIAPAVLLLVGALALGLAAAWAAWRASRPAEVLLLGILAAIAVLYAGQTVARPDRPHVAWALWPLVLLVSALLALSLAAGVRAVRLAAGVGILASVVVAHTYGPAGRAGAATALGRMLAPPHFGAAGPMPRDIDLAGPGLRAAAEAVRATTPACTLAMTNEGLLHLLAAAPPCSRFAFPIHVGSGHEPAVIAELARQPPPTILFDSPFWGARIDGVRQVDRTPLLAAWIAREYPHERVLAGNYRMRFRQPPPDE